MKIKEIREMLGLSQLKFADKYNIPVRSVQNWEAPEDSPNHRDCPEYVAKLLERVAEEDHEKEMAAVKKVIEIAGFEPTEERTSEWLMDGSVTLNKARNGRDVAWLLFEGHKKCIYVDNLTELTAEEIEKELS